MAVTNENNQMNVKALQKSKPRYTEAENKTLFESWWDPQKRLELEKRLGRQMNALRSQFFRILKEKGLSIQDYYAMMSSRAGSNSAISPRRRSRELKDIDRIILETFCKHQALGNSRTQACEELRNKLGSKFTHAALKLRFYRLVKMLQYKDKDLRNMGSQLLGKPVLTPVKQTEVKKNDETRDIVSTYIEHNEAHDEVNSLQIQPDQNHLQDKSFFYQLSSLPENVINIEKRLLKLEEQQRRQLDLRGFIEHLLAVERDMKREDQLLLEIQRLSDENENIRHSLDKERERLKKREEELADVFKILDSTLSDFMHLESVPKLASLGDFMHRLEITVDQFGNVLKSKRVMS